MIKAKVAFLESRLFSANQSFLKTFQIALIGWIKANPPKSHFCFDHVIKLTVRIKSCEGRNHHIILKMTCYVRAVKEVIKLSAIFLGRAT